MPSNSKGIGSIIGYATQHLQYLPYGETFVDQHGAFDSRYKFSAKELDDKTGYNYFGARYLDTELGVWLSVDPLSDEYPHQSPFMYCSGNPVMRVDMTGATDNPIYDVATGNFLGTDDEGLQGEAILMNKSDFKQGMSHEEAMSKGKTLDNMSYSEAHSFCKNGSFNKFIDHYNSLSSRPDWDGYLTLDEANDWYRNGNGQSLFTSLKKIDLSGIYSFGDKYVGQVKSINLIYNASSSWNDALVYGNITLKRYPNHTVRAFADKYNFDLHNQWNPMNWLRNNEVLIGIFLVGEGTPYDINIYGSQKLTPILPGLK